MYSRREKVNIIMICILSTGTIVSLLLAMNISGLVKGLLLINAGILGGFLSSFLIRYFFLDKH